MDRAGRLRQRCRLDPAWCLLDKCCIWWLLTWVACPCRKKDIAPTRCGEPRMWHRRQGSVQKGSLSRDWAWRVERRRFHWGRSCSWFVWWRLKTCRCCMVCTRWRGRDPCRWKTCLLDSSCIERLLSDRHRRCSCRRSMTCRWFARTDWCMFQRDRARIDCCFFFLLERSRR